MKKAFLSDYLMMLDIQDNIAYAANGDIILCYQLVLPEIYSLGEIDYDALSDVWYKLIQGTSAPAIIVKQDIYVQKNYETGTFPENNHLQKATKEYFRGKPYLSHTCYLYFIYSGNSILKNSAIRNPFKKLPSKKTFEEAIRTKKKFIDEVHKSIDFLQNQKYLEVRPLQKEEIEFLTFYYFNGLYDDRITDAFKRQDSGYQIGNKQVGVYALTRKKQLPEILSNCIKDPKMSLKEQVFFQGFTDSFGLRLDCDHIVNQFFFIEDNNVLKKEIIDKQGQFFGARGFAEENNTVAKKLKEEIVHMEEKNTRLVGIHFNVTYFGNGERFAEVDKEISTVFKNLSTTPYYAKGNNLCYLFNTSYFGNISTMRQEDIFRVGIEEAVCLISQTTSYKDDGEGVLFNDRIYNIPLRKDIWDAGKKRINARNFMIVAPTGEGKSFLANHIFSQVFEQSYNLVIFDLGGSYEKLSLLFPKEEIGYIQYEEGRPLGINPFLLDKDGFSIVKQNELIDFIWRLWKRRNKDKDTDKQQIVSLRKLLVYYYESVDIEEVSFPSFYHFIGSQQDSILEEQGIEATFFDIGEFLHVCSEFVGNGAYSFLFEHPEESFDVIGKRLIIFELDAAVDDPLLLSVLLQMGVETVRKMIWQDKSIRGYVFFDEFAKLLKYDTVLSSVEYYSQAIRKQTGGLGLVLQTPNQLPKNSTAESIIDNNQVLYILKANNYDDIVDRFKLSEHDRQQLNSINNRFSGKEPYSEFLLKIGNESNVMRLHTAKEVRLAYMTEGEENNILMKLFEGTGNMQEAINKYMSHEKDNLDTIL